jgi:hypothetical protein
MTTITTFELPDGEWEGIVQCSDLPAQARPLVEEAVALFRAFETADRCTASEIRSELQELHGLAVGLHSRLAKVMTNPDAHVALTVASTFPQDGSSNRFLQSRIEAHCRLESSLKKLDALADWLLMASRRVVRMKPGATRKAKNTQWLVARLDAIREEFTARKITRSKKRTDLSRDYIKAVCRIADPAVGTGTIDRAMQLRIKQANARDRITAQIQT